MSVPLPAIFVAIVTAPDLPAWATISDSLWTFSGLAFNKLCGICSSSKRALINSLFSTLVVPTSTGLPCWWIAEISFATALHFAVSVLKTWSVQSSREIFLFVGITVVCNLYVLSNSTSSVFAVPVIPDKRGYKRKKFWYVIEARVWVSGWIASFSFASIAWCWPSLHLLPGITLPVNSSTMTASPSLII